MTTATSRYLNMSLVHDPAVASALPQLLTDWRMKKRWESLGAGSRALHRSILGAYLDAGNPPKLSATDLDALADLGDRDLVVADGRAITAAYPFSTAKTRHKVVVDGVSIACVCAIDALGVSAMTGRASQASSSCAVCDRAISVDIAGDGLTVTHVSQDAPLVWAGIVNIDGCAADTQCQSMLMFCGQDHLNVWLQSSGTDPAGFAFSVPQAVQAGAAIFQPFLAKPDRGTGEGPA